MTDLDFITIEMLMTRAADAVIGSSDRPARRRSLHPPMVIDRVRRVSPAERTTRKRFQIKQLTVTIRAVCALAAGEISESCAAVLPDTRRFVGKANDGDVMLLNAERCIDGGGFRRRGGTGTARHHCVTGWCWRLSWLSRRQ